MSIQETVVVTVVASAFNTPRIKMNLCFWPEHTYTKTWCVAPESLYVSQRPQRGLHGRNEGVLGRGEPTVWAMYTLVL